MNATVAVAAREVNEKKFILAGAVIAAILPFLTALLPGLARSNRLDGQVLLASILAVGVSFGLAMLLGATMIGRDLSEHRLTFYFSRPLSPAALWFGKLGASLFLALAAGAIILVPSMLVTTEQHWFAVSALDTPALLGLLAAGVVALTLVTHALGTMVRSRSALALLDLIVFAVLGAVAWRSVRNLAQDAGPTLAGIELATLAGVVLATLTGAGVYQLSRGRTVASESHRALSRALWSTLGIAVLLLVALNAYLTYASPEELKRPQVTRLHGNWSLIEGTVRERDQAAAAFLIDSRTGRSLRVRPLAFWSQPIASSDGNHAFWTARSREQGIDGSLIHATLGDRPRVEQVDLPHGAWSLATNASGSRLVVSQPRADGNQITLYDVSGFRSLGSVQLPDGAYGDDEATFLGNDRIRIVSAEHGPRPDTPSRLSIWEWTPSTKHLEKTGQTETAPSFIRNASLANGSLFVEMPVGPHDYRAQLLDGRTAQPLRTLWSSERRSGDVIQLRDGRLAAITTRGGAKVLRIEGLPDLPVGGNVVGAFAGELSPGKLALSIVSIHTPWMSRQAETLIVDTKSGRLLARLPDLRSDRVSGFRMHELAAEATAGGEPLFVNAEGTLVRLDPVTYAPHDFFSH